MKKISKKSMYILCTSLVLGIATSTVIAGGTIASKIASGLSYQDSVDVTFTLNPTVNISLSSSDLTISDLAPGSSSDSNIITVTTSSNATAGYSVYGTVGNSTYNTTNLKHTSSTDTFTKLTTAGTLGDGEWGYSYATPATTDASGNVTAWNTWSKYNNLPLYNDTSAEAVTLIESGDAGSKTIGFKIGAKAKDAQIAGNYNNVINFIAVAEDIPDVTYIQDLTLAQCSKNVGEGSNPANVGDEITVTDSRDNNTYTVRYINGACWMTQNLAIEPGTHMTADDTNITPSEYNNTTYYALPGTGYDLRDNASGTSANCYGVYSSGSGTYTGNGWLYACTHVATDTDVSEIGSSACNGITCTKEQLGAWYNYAAATAGTIRGTSDNIITNSDVDTYNICPKGWTLPANGTSTGQISSVTSYASSFNPLYGGRYYNGSLNNATTNGYWWSTAVGGAHNRFTLNYNSSNLGSTIGLYRYGGGYVRCVRTS